MMIPITHKILVSPNKPPKPRYCTRFGQNMDYKIVESEDQAAVRMAMINRLTPHLEASLKRVERGLAFKEESRSKQPDTLDLFSSTVVLALSNLLSKN